MVTKNRLTLDISFLLEDDAEHEMLLGPSVTLRPAEAQITFIDGSLSEATASLDLRCPNAATVSCRATEIGAHKRCDSYFVDYKDQCIFRSTHAMYRFSDHNKTLMELAGEISLLSEGKAEIKFANVSWDDLH